MYGTKYSFKIKKNNSNNTYTLTLIFDSSQRNNRMSEEIDIEEFIKMMETKILIPYLNYNKRNFFITFSEEHIRNILDKLLKYFFKVMGSREDIQDNTPEYNRLKNSAQKFITEKKWGNRIIQTLDSPNLTNENNSNLSVHPNIRRNIQILKSMECYIYVSGIIDRNIEGSYFVISTRMIDSRRKDELFQITLNKFYNNRKIRDKFIPADIKRIDVMKEYLIQMTKDLIPNFRKCPSENFDLKMGSILFLYVPKSTVSIIEEFKKIFKINQDGIYEFNNK